MYYRKSTMAIAVFAALGLAACGGSDGGGGGGGGGGTDTSGGDDGANSESFQQDFRNSDRYGVTESANVSINEGTLAIDAPDASASGDSGGTFTTDAGDSVTPAGYHGAVDPGVSDANDDPSDDGPFWDGWAYRSEGLSTNLPAPGANGANFHPLEQEISASGGIEPANNSNCSNIGNGLADGGKVEWGNTGKTFPVCIIQDGDLDTNTTLTNDHIYVLGETVQVGNGDEKSANQDSAGVPSGVDQFTLEIQKGTQIFGDQDEEASLVITRGSDIDAVGTAAQPIIFGGVDTTSTGEIEASEDITKLDARGKWGSLVISGYGKVNSANDNNQLQTEAVPDDVTRWFGGVDNDDDSGQIKFAVVAETGTSFRQDEEVQGITVEGAGGGTTFENIQIINSDDDGIEWFGGAANARNFVIQAATDDPLDQDLGWQGTVKKALVIHGPNSGNRGMETDNNGSNAGKQPKTKPILANVTILGHRGNETDLSQGALHREGYGGTVLRSVYMDNTSSVAGGNAGDAAAEFQDGCLDIDTELDEDLEYIDVLFNCAQGALGDK